MRSLLSLLIAISILTVPFSAIAQSSTLDVTIEIIPLNPEPGESVSLKAISYGADLNQAQITWNYNGKLIASGTGVTTASVVAPVSGSTGVVSVIVKAVGFDDTISNITMRPGSVDLLWEASDAYTPPFYKGKALLPVGGEVRITAILSATAPKGASYTWSRNNSVVGDASGYGKSSLTFTQNMLINQEKVDVSVSGGTFGGTTTIRLVPDEPQVVAYQNNEGFIDWANGYRDTIFFNKPGMLLHFEPYYFSTIRGVSDLIFDIKVDNQAISPGTPNEIGLSRPAQAGQSSLSLAITTVAYGLQHVEKTFNLLFN